MLRLAENFTVVKDYGLRSGNAELLSNTRIAKGEIVAVFGETVTVDSWQEVDHDPMPIDECDGNSEQARCGIVTTNSSAISPRDLPPVQPKVNLILLQVEPD